MADLQGLAADAHGQTVSYLLNRFSPYVDRMNKYHQVLEALIAGKLDVAQLAFDENHQLIISPPLVTPSVPATNGKNKGREETKVNA
jgi:hypothetical protein